MPELRDLIDAAMPAAREFRHDLHRHPELGYQELRTANRIRAALIELGVAFRSGLAGGTGTVGFLPATISPETARTVALRADIDALPIQEETSVPYCSETPGKMHACGHDGHTTILLTTAKVLSELPERPQNVLFMFQPAEEGGAGAKRMIEDGALDGSTIGYPADVVYGLHGFPTWNVGHVSTRVGPLMAAACQFRIRITGKGAHAAYPHYGIDPIVVGAHIITALQTIASRTIGPLDSVVVTVGRVIAGVAHNVIPEEAILDGTVRTLNDATELRAKEAIVRIATQTALAFGASATVEWATDPYPTTVNHPEATARFREVARETLGPEWLHEEPEPSMGGEDFSFYGRKVPACFFFLGLRPKDWTSYPNLHAPDFDFNDDSLPIGVELMAQLALQG